MSKKNASILTREFLQKECLLYTDKSLANKVGVHRATISRRRKKYNVPKYVKRLDWETTLLGKTFNRLTVLQYLGLNKKSKHYEVKCLCSCGNKVVSDVYHVLNSNTKSCGCLVSEVSSFHNYLGGKYITWTEFNSRIHRSANKRNIYFNLTLQQLENIYEQQNKRCLLSGRKLFFDSTRKNNPDGTKKIKPGNASVDRIDSKKGYTINNVQLVHKYVNFAKHTLSQTDFIDLCIEVTNYQKTTK